MIDLLLPSTDAGVAVQFATVRFAGTIGVVLTRRRPDVRLLVIGMTLLLAVLMSARAVH